MTTRRKSFTARLIDHLTRELRGAVAEAVREAVQRELSMGERADANARAMLAREARRADGLEIERAALREELARAVAERRQAEADQATAEVAVRRLELKQKAAHELAERLKRELAEATELLASADEKPPSEPVRRVLHYLEKADLALEDASAVEGFGGDSALWNVRDLVTRALEDVREELAERPEPASLSPKKEPAPKPTTPELPGLSADERQALDEARAAIERDDRREARAAARAAPTFAQPKTRAGQRKREAAVARTLECPKCGATPGEDCEGEGTHGERFAVARERLRQADAAMGIECPKCGAAPGAPCMDGGKPGIHSDRVTAARKGNESDDD